VRVILNIIITFFIPISIQASQVCQPGSIPSSTTDAQLIDNGDQTIIDVKTGLMWKKCSEGLSGDNCDVDAALFFTWQQALERPGFVNQSGGFANYYDWRLPDVRELLSIVEEECYDPAINLNRFPNTPSSFAWSASPSRGNIGTAWNVSFGYGLSTYSAVRFNYHNVRLVRGGQ